MISCSFAVLCVTVLVTCLSVSCDYLEVSNFDSPFEGEFHPCYRECGGPTMICEYNFTIRSGTSMNNIDCGRCPFILEDCLQRGCTTGGGILRTVITVNQKIPGPSILVCEHDRIVVNVKNELRTDTASIHWHGIHQTGSLFMDGLPYVTQYPIQPLGTFRYDFIAEPHGTQLWHGHSGFQEADGLFGILTVRRKEPEYIRALYNLDLPQHSIIIWHWYDKPTGDVLQTVLHQNGSIFGYGFLINGKGALKEYKSNDGNKYYTPREIFKVRKGIKYRFRMIYNSAIYCPLQISVDDHKLIMFASDTSPFEPIEVDSFMISAGERFDFILEANQTERCYWLRLRAIGDCGEKKNSLHDGAMICYNGTQAVDTGTELSYDLAKKSGVLLNPSEVLTENYSKNKIIHLTDLNSTEISENNYNLKPNVTFYVEINTRPIDILRYPGPWHQFNNISFQFPNTLFLKNQMQTDGADFCEDENKYKNCKDNFCSCIYLKKIQKDSLVELVLLDTTKNRDQDHPIHMHGYQFYVIGQGVYGKNITLEEIKYKNENGFLKKKLKNAPSKDTISVPNKGYIILRFIANNIGFWIFHCHVTNHMELGMALLFQVGTRDEILKMCSKQTDYCNEWYQYQPSSGYQLIINYHIFLLIVLFKLIL